MLPDRRPRATPRPIYTARAACAYRGGRSAASGVTLRRLGFGSLFHSAKGERRD